VTGDSRAQLGAGDLRAEVAQQRQADCQNLPGDRGAGTDA